MIYGYIRVSTDKQTVENQRFEINNFCETRTLIVDKWFEETISGTKEVKKRQLGKLLKKMKEGDILICAELSRLGRSLFMIMDVLNHCMENGIKVWTIKDNYRLGDDISSKVLAFAFGLSAEIERNLISQRTKEALARKKAEGVTLGRPKGRKSAKIKLSGQEKKIYDYLKKGVSYSAIGRILGVHRLTVSNFAKTRIGENGEIKPIVLDERYESEYNKVLPVLNEIKNEYLQGKPMYVIAKEYEVSRKVISHLLRGKK